jgi:hypothetical protein
MNTSDSRDSPVANMLRPNISSAITPIKIRASAACHGKALCRVERKWKARMQQRLPALPENIGIKQY